MSYDATHVALSGAGALAGFIKIGEVTILVLWCFYLLVLIATKLPELAQKYPSVDRLLFRLTGRRFSGQLDKGKTDGDS